MPCLAITGANGFIGRHLTKAALARRWSVRALSRNTHWLRSLTPNDNLAIHQWDLTHSQDPQILAGVDVVCHLAADLPLDYDDPSYAQACLLNNALATQHLLEAAWQRGFAGSFEAHSHDPARLSLRRARDSKDRLRSHRVGAIQSANTPPCTLIS